MAVAPDGELALACPNFADPSVPATFVRIDKDRKVRKWFDAPVLKATGRCCPMGIEFGPGGELYIADNQNWAGGNGANGEINQGRILRVNFRDGKPAETIVVAQGISHPNGVKYRDGQLYVTVSTLPKVKRPDGLLTSAVYRFPAGGKNIQVSNTLADKNLLVTFVTQNKFCQYGVDGIVFDSQGNLFIGNFGDGAVHKITFDGKGNLTANTLFAKTDLDYSLDPKVPGFLAKATLAKMRTTDGMCVDGKDNLYVADFSNNAIAKITPAGVISVVAQGPDSGGRNGDLNQPGEPVVWNNLLVVSNFDAVMGPDKVNVKHETPAKLSVLKLP
jgi:sugar lactone lactonase YvrE